MKATKKIVGAACALVAAVALSAGTTFAWFAQNDTVSASGMDLTVSTSSSYLLIGNSTQKSDAANDTAFRNNISYSTTFVNDGSDLKPVAHEAGITSENVSQYTTQWYTAVSKLPGVSNDTEGDNVKNKTNIAGATGYVVEDTLYVTVRPGSGPSEELHANGVTIEKAGEKGNNVKPVSVILVCGTNLVEYKHNGTGWIVQGASTLLATSVADTDAGIVTVAVYVYYDGEHADVTTNNAAYLAGASVSISLVADDDLT